MTVPIRAHRCQLSAGSSSILSARATTTSRIAQRQAGVGVGVGKTASRLVTVSSCTCRSNRRQGPFACIYPGLTEMQLLPIPCTATMRRHVTPDFSW